jgi:hypothetical protein
LPGYRIEIVNVSSLVRQTPGLAGDTLILSVVALWFHTVYAATVNHYGAPRWRSVKIEAVRVRYFCAPKAQ